MSMDEGAHENGSRRRWPPSLAPVQLTHTLPLMKHGDDLDTELRQGEINRVGKLSAERAPQARVHSWICAWPGFNANKFRINLVEKGVPQT